MDDSLIYRKTRRGATELAASHGTLSAPARRVLILLDGRRTLAELAELFGAESVQQLVSELEQNGFARLVDPNDPVTTESLPPGAYPARQAAPPPEEPRRSGLGAFVLLLMAAAAAGGGYWYLAVRAHAPAEPMIATAGASETDRASIALVSAQPGSTAVDSPQQAGGPTQQTRELPLSGLPAVTVNPPGTARALSAAAARSVRADESAARRIAAAAAPSAPAPDAEPKPEPKPAPQAVPPPETVLAAADPSPMPSARALPVAAAEPLRPQRTAVNVPAGMPVPAARAFESVSDAPARAAAPAAGDKPAQSANVAGTAAGSAAPPAAPAQQVAALAPPAQPRSGPVSLHPRRHDPPEYPTRALRARILEGHVLARIWVTAEGSVEQVDILKATPARVFDEEVKRALSLWTFDPPGHPLDTTVELDFKP